MSAFRLASSGDKVLNWSNDGSLKVAFLRVKGPSSYDTNGSVLDLSSANADNGATGTAKFSHFAKVYSVEVIAVEAHGNDKYDLKFVPGSSHDPATGTLKVRDLSAASDAEVGSTTDLSAVVWTMRVVGR